MFLDIFSSDKKNRNIVYKLRKHNNAEIEAKDILLNNGVTSNNIVYCETDEELINNSDVIVSAITVAKNILGEDSWYKKGVTVIPIHTRGFQNCDLFFDKVFADDRDHVSDFMNFDKFKSFNEIEDVLKEKVKGRENDEERILSYNIGIALHDIYLGKMIFDKYANK
jgi:ornithine cyclodeaminase/alanine dehydrogenase-like protein (mu-crystallin family)